MKRAPKLLFLLVALAGFGVALDAAAQSASPHWFPPGTSLRPAEDPPLRLAARKGLTSLASLGKASVEEAPALAEIARWNEQERLPAKNGFARTLGKTTRVDLNLAAALPFAGAIQPHAGGLLTQHESGDLVWGAEVRVEGSYRVRLKLSDVHLPASARLWVYSAAGETIGPFGIESATPGGRELWTPSVAGPSARIELAIPGKELAANPPGGDAATWGFTIGQVMEIVPVGSTLEAAKLGECLVDAECASQVSLDVNTLALVQRAVAALQFVSGGASFLCSGGLISDVASSGTPYLWTANHCISRPAEAASLEAFWDYVSLGCSGPPPALGNLERSFSSTLLATGAASDFTLLQLNSLPDGRVFFGWSANSLATLPGTEVHRISHPFGAPQRYSSSSISGTARACFGAPEPLNIYHTTTLGGTFGGSSGGPLFLPNGQVVGQLAGGCPQNGDTDPFDGCDYDNAEVDGAFSASFDSVSQFLAGAPSIPCSDTDTALCLTDSRFQVEVDWKTRAGDEGAGRVVPFRSDNSGLYYFFNSANWEMLIKVLNGCTVNGHYWVFFAATTNVEFTVNVTDTQTGQVKQYFNPLGQPADAVTDTEAFAVCP